MGEGVLKPEPGVAVGAEVAAMGDAAEVIAGARAAEARPALGAVAAKSEARCHVRGPSSGASET
jgi:hypothetical protein